MKSRPRPLISVHSLARGAIWAALLLAAISTFTLTRAADDTGPDDLPNAPSAEKVFKNLVAVKLPSFELRLKPGANIGGKEVVVKDVIFNPSLSTAAPDLVIAINTYVKTYYDAVAAVQNGNANQAWDNLINTTKNECPRLNTNGIVALLSLYGNNLWNNYNYKYPWAPTPLNSVAESLVLNNKNAGVCRDIHTALAEIAGACGLQDVGAMFANWQSGKVDDPHAPAYYRDPNSGQFIIINYASKFNTGTKYLPQAADIAAQQLSPTSMAAYPETGIGTSKSAMHEILTTRGSAILGSINDASDLGASRPAIEISVGNLDISGSAQVRHELGSGFEVGVYAAANDSRETGALFGSVGGMIAQDAHVGITDKVDFNSNSQLTMGVFDIHDKDFEANVRNALEGIVLVKSSNAVAWHTDHAPGSISATIEQADDFTDHMIGVPYNFLSLKMELNATQFVKVHAQTTQIITTHTIQNTAFAVRPVDDAVGADFKKTIKNTTVDSDTTFHFLGGVHHGVQGEEENAKFTINTHAGSVSTGGNLFVVQNPTTDFFYSVPVYCRAKVEYDKTIKSIDVQATADYRCNHVGKLSLPGEQPPGEDWGISKPRGSLGLTVSWGNQK